MKRSIGLGQVAWLTLAAAALAGCGPRQVEFHENLAYMHMSKLSESPASGAHQQNIADIMLANFGTPDEPQLPLLPGEDWTKVVDPQKLSMSAGPTRSDRSGTPVGLFREHCVHCHGVTGDGMGPTAAFLNPYPRDYRRGTFKFKSTKKGLPPTHEDLTRILMDGVPGTAMPSFNVLDKDEIESLIHYVRYLSIRGEVERNLILEVATDLGDEERLLDLAKKEELPARLERINEITATIVKKWQNANAQATPVPPPPAEWKTDEKQRDAAVARGRELFYGPIANCIKCHGDSALGDGQTTDFDEWTKELEPTRPDRVHEYLAVGALPPRNIRPRNLRLGNYRGGRRPLDLFWRITNGIDGTPMPEVPKLTADNAKGLSPDDVWCLVEYVRQLPYETISQIDRNVPTNARERN